MQYRVVAEAEADEVLPVARRWFETGVFVIGSDPDCDWCLPVAGVSRRHLSIRVLEDGGFILQDLDSRNGTRLQGKRIREVASDGPIRIDLGAVSVLFAAAGEGAQLLMDMSGGKSSPLDMPLAPTTIAADRFGSCIAALIDALRRCQEASRDQRLQAMLDALLDHVGFSSVTVWRNTEGSRLLRVAAGVAEGDVYSEMHAEDEYEITPAAVTAEAWRLSILRLVAEMDTTIAAFERPASLAIGVTAEIDDEVIADLTTDPEFAAQLKLVARVADSALSVLLLGESGVGKEVIARFVHESSPRSNGAYFALNCAALPKDLIEAELFGIERGVATGVNERAGLIERANGGSFLLDEVGELPVDLQAKLLRVLETREVIRIGARQTKLVDVRILAATNVSLEDAIREGRFRLDLYHRLAGYECVSPPLRARRSDIGRLTRRFLDECLRQRGIIAPGITEAALVALFAYGWPGNVRELRNEITRASLLMEPGEPLDVRHLSARIRAVSSGQTALSLEAQLRRAERDALASALSMSGNDLERAQGILAIGRSTLYRKLKEHGLGG
jgi:transcriptional regulator with PAS, ATPase and Fis domain